MVNFLKAVFRILTKKREVSPQTRDLINKDWQEVELLLRGDTPSQLKQALILADRSLDLALKDLVPGEAMGERLKNAKNLFSAQLYDKIWQAHKLRNSLVHESGFEAQSFMIKSAVKNLKEGLGELKLYGFSKED